MSATLTTPIWTPNSAFGTHIYTGAAMSKSGQYQIFTNQDQSTPSLFRSSDYGATFSEVSVSFYAAYPAMSASGQYMYAGDQGTMGGKIWRSSNYGATWTELTNSAAYGYYTVSCSADGSTILGTASTDLPAQLSNDFGATWTSITSLSNIIIGAMDASGKYMLLGTNTSANSSAGAGGPLYLSTDYGVTWTSTAYDVSGAPTNMCWSCAAISDSGQHMTAGATQYNETNIIYVSNDYGATWTAKSTSYQQELDNCMDSTGQYQLLTSWWANAIHYSSDFGATWYVTSVGGDRIYGVAMSGNASYMTLADNATGYIYSSNTSASTSGTPSAINLTATLTSAVGNGTAPAAIATYLADVSNNATNPTQIATTSLCDLLVATKVATTAQTANRAATEMAVNAALLAKFTVTDVSSGVVVDGNGNVSITVPGGTGANNTAALLESFDSVAADFDVSKPYTRVIPGYTQMGSTNVWTGSYTLTNADVATINGGSGYFGFSIPVSVSGGATYRLTVVRNSSSVTLTYNGSNIVDANAVVYNLDSVIQIGDVNYRLKEFGSVGGVGSGVVCFLANAPVLTPSGYRRIDSLAVGDLVQTTGGKAVAIQRIKHQRVAPGPTANPYVIPKGSYGATETLAISPRHCVVIPGRGFVEARELGLKQMPMKAAFDYYNLELPEWENMVVAGVAVESLAPKKRITVTPAVAKAFLAGLARARGLDAVRKALATFTRMEDGNISMLSLPKRSI